MSPQIVGRYAIHQEIAAGGMASVHFARLVGPSGFARTVAVKRAHPHLARDPDFALMFLDEARLAARVHHPNVAGIIDVLQTEEELLLVMEYVHGESLWKLVHAASDRGERVPLAIAGAIVIDMLHGLHAAHEATDEQGRPLGLVHRDVSPQNILVGADGVTRLVDFGIAKAAGRLHSTRDSSVKGKFAYMAPEQARGEPVSRLSDTYAAAIVLWELLTGERLFAGRTDAETVHKLLVARVARPSLHVPDLDPRLDAVLERGLCRAPDGRYETAREMALAIEACVPAVRASEVGAWVQRLAGDGLLERQRALAAIESADAEGTPPPSRTGSRLSPRTPDEPTTPAASVMATSRAGTSSVRFGPRASLWLALAALALAVGTATVVVERRIPVSAATASPSPSSPSSPVAPPSAMPALSTPAAAASAPGAVVPAGSASIAAASASPSVPSAATRPGRTPSAGRPGPGRRSGACDPPYSIDSAGLKIFKPECM